MKTSTPSCSALAQNGWNFGSLSSSPLTLPSIPELPASSPSGPSPPAPGSGRERPPPSRDGRSPPPRGGAPAPARALRPGDRSRRRRGRPARRRRSREIPGECSSCRLPSHRFHGVVDAPSGAWSRACAPPLSVAATATSACRDENAQTDAAAAMASSFTTSPRLSSGDICLILPVRPTPSDGAAHSVWWRENRASRRPKSIALRRELCFSSAPRGQCPAPARHMEGSIMAKGTLIAAMNMARAAEDEFHDWYDTEHLPERVRVPGFLVCQRRISTQDRKISVATYDLDSVAVLTSPAYQAIGGQNLSPWSKRVTAQVERLMRFEGDQILPGDQLPPDKAEGLLPNAMNIAPELEAEFNEWYDKEHIQTLSAVTGVICARTYVGHS